MLISETPLSLCSSSTVLLQATFLLSADLLNNCCLLCLNFIDNFPSFQTSHHPQNLKTWSKYRQMSGSELHTQPLIQVLIKSQCSPKFTQSGGYCINISILVFWVIMNIVYQALFTTFYSFSRLYLQTFPNSCSNQLQQCLSHVERYITAKTILIIANFSINHFSIMGTKYLQLK